MYHKHVAKFRPNDHKVICDTCGLTFMHSKCRLNHDGFLQCSDCYDVKHPQDNIYAKTDKATVDVARPEPENDEQLTFGVGDKDLL